ncbi:2,5-diketo-D-gluconic acid reductase [Helicobacter valdiviensis]|uniref:2,5-diketo-D-gluconic acid reductase n=1 Tax=Helicobacter valdiviensis TaxID=1458358 RepID=A0A2W6MUE2_9HELI|nr:aldo/keto reductase [Helicobacter valdiviensis]PZT48145.1 2,5-diketo-D-gluconic acid reductase [Helicobacter valdiviensis]
MQTIALNDGNKMPILGYGVFQIDPKETQKCVEDALSVGYRLIDTAAIYGNESAVGAAIKASGVARNELFITTKLWINNISRNNAKAAFMESLKKLGLEYIDLYLIHQPFNDSYGAWEVMCELKKEGLVKSIGVSNFYPDKLTDFYFNNEVKPALNQVECHPFLPRFDFEETMKNLGVTMQSWASFAEGKNDIFNNEILKNIAKKHNKSIAQVILRWLIQREITVIPKTLSKERMQENISVFDFALDPKDMEQIATISQNPFIICNHRDVKTAEFLLNLAK